MFSMALGFLPFIPQVNFRSDWSLDFFGVESFFGAFCLFNHHSQLFILRPALFFTQNCSLFSSYIVCCILFLFEEFTNHQHI